MKWLTTLVSVAALTTALWAEPNAERLDNATAAAKALAQKQDYRGAAAVFAPLSADIAITALTGWPNAQVEHARYLARSGEPDQAMTVLAQAIDLGAGIKASELDKDEAFAALRERPAFRTLTAKLRQRDRLWQDNPALATPYKPMLSEEEKVAGLSKLWAEARFNFPFFDRIPDVDWDAAYMEALAKVRAAKTTEDYYAVLTRFVALLKDGHTRVLPPAELQDRFNGITALRTRLIEGKILVTGIDNPALASGGIRIGDEVIAIDGTPARRYADTVVAPVVFGFTPQDRAVWQYGFQLLRGPVGQDVTLTLQHADGKSYTAAVPRIHNDGAFGIMPPLKTTAAFKLLPGNIAYLRIDWFVDDSGLKTLKENFAAASAAKGLVIDVRENGGGNDDYSHALVAVLADKPFYGSTWRTVDYKAAYRSWNRPQGWYRSAAPLMQPDPNLHYAKPVVVLIGGRTYSASEDFLVSYISSGRGKLVGETSGGSTGNPMLFKLPGGGMAFICTKDDAFYDGRVFEGVGIAPDVTVKPTVADIQQGRDPVLEKAVEMLKSPQ